MKTIQEGTLKQMAALKKDGKSFSFIGRKYHKTKQKIHYIFKKYSIVISHGHFRWRCERCDHLNERDYSLFIEKERFQNEVCDRCGIKRTEMDKDKLFCG
jgi:hypothetical protein